MQKAGSAQKGYKMRTSSLTETRQAYLAALLTVPLSALAFVLTLGFFGTVV